ncbi:hypothetical protein HW132_25135 [Brasilonema sp. CT11]|nr:hypothetical protein [Brasilonema sp. CT11]
MTHFSRLWVGDQPKAAAKLSPTHQASDYPHSGTVENSFNLNLCLFFSNIAY